jgi:hypothetical protein
VLYLVVSGLPPIVIPKYGNVLKTLFIAVSFPCFGPSDSGHFERFVPSAKPFGDDLIAGNRQAAESLCCEHITARQLVDTAHFGNQGVVSHRPSTIEPFLVGSQKLLLRQMLQSGMFKRTLPIPKATPHRVWGDFW